MRAAGSPASTAAAARSGSAQERMSAMPDASAEFGPGEDVVTGEVATPLVELADGDLDVGAGQAGLDVEGQQFSIAVAGPAIRFRWRLLGPIDRTNGVEELVAGLGVVRRGDLVGHLVDDGGGGIVAEVDRIGVDRLGRNGLDVVDHQLEPIVDGVDPATDAVAVS